MTARARAATIAAIILCGAWPLYELLTQLSTWGDAEALALISAISLAGGAWLLYALLTQGAR